MVIAPLIFLTIVTGIAGMGELKSVGRVAGKAFIYFLCFSTLALVIGLIVANVVQPGAGMNIDPASLDTAAISEYTKRAHDTTLTGFLLNIIPETFVGAFTDHNILQVLFLAILFGISLALVGDRAQPALTILDSVAAG
eukprot:TRINITY_DN28381_c0_g1_i1.p3 TRINITY_DN28381_c0_g1~~TRINITY_DN28381_c0_g1_i1.p3  ORF type:complete len:139 (+),score=52.61 TRINITY_DN28381_c0_g1_i1:91-507(+)